MASPCIDTNGQAAYSLKATTSSLSAWLPVGKRD